MKHAKKLLALALVFAMALALAVPAFADDDGKITITMNGTQVEVDLPAAPADGSGIQKHDFAAYQIFAAEYAEKADGSEDTEKLVSIHWGANVNVDGLLAALKTAGLIGDNIGYNEGENADAYKDAGFDPVAYDVARVVSDFNDTDARHFAEIVDANLTGDPVAAQGYDESGTVTLPAGYYLIVDTARDGETEEEVRNLAVLSMSAASPFKPQSKVDVPELEKKVMDLNDSDTLDPENYEWDSTADYDLNDDVPFVLTGTLPTNFDEYETYKYVFHDTLSAGLTFNDDVQVLLDGSDVTDSFTVTKDGQSFTVGIENLKVIPGVTAGSVIRVVYTAKLTAANIVVQNNEAYLEFSNDPDSDGTGNTPKDKVTVFTFKLTFDKVDENGDALPGAGFTLYKWNAGSEAEDKWEPVGEEQVIEELVNGEAVFNFEGLDAGKYKIIETTVPAGYNKAEDIEFAVVATEEGDKIVSLDVTGTGAESVQVEKNDDEAQTPTGTLKTTITNRSGVKLPSTGGIGTTIFYVAGGLLLVGAAVVLIAKKRMGAAE